MPAATASASSLVENLGKTLPPHFQQAQATLANHRKNIVSLHRLHASCATLTQDTPKGTKLVGEKAFNDVFLACLNRVLGIKRGVANADRAIKFVAGYCTYAQEQFRLALRAANKEAGAEAEEDEEEEDTTATRFVTILLKHLLRGFGAKNKNVRLRCCQTVALLINGLESMDDDLFEALKGALLVRAKDRESSVRVQAVVALAKLQGAEGDDGDDMDDGDATNITSVLLRVLQYDPSAEVRRAALFNLPTSQKTLPFILERLRDVDTVNRRCLYLGSLSNAVLEQSSCSAKLGPGDWAHVVRTGLGEREESVVRAVKKLMASWIDAASSLTKDPLDSFLTRFDVLRSPEVTASALKAVFEVRPTLLDAIAFDDDFWSSLTAERAFVARQFVDHCKSSLGRDGERRMEEAMPLVTALAFRTQAAWASLLEKLEEGGQEEDADILIRQSILDSLLHVSMSADYGDEIGRRKMFGLVRDMISSPVLPQPVIEPCLDVLLKLSAGQRDFVRIVVEIVNEMWDLDGEADGQGNSDEDEDEEDEAAVENQIINGGASPTKRSTGGRATALSPEEAQVAVRRLVIVRGMLERVAGGMQENTAMHGLVSQLIAPAVKSKDESIRQQGLACLTLCCLLDAKLALNTFGLFLQQMQEAQGLVRLTSVRAVFDSLTVHGIPYLCRPQVAAAGGGPEAVAMVHAQMVNFLLSLLEDEDLDVQATAAEGMAKLMLAGIVEDDDALRSLVLVYMSPETTNNQALRQCLSYFLPVYCFSSAACQRRLQRVFLPILQVLTEVYYERDESTQDMVTPLQVGLQLVEWTDPTKVHSTSVVDQTIHLGVAMDLIRALYKVEDKEERKVMVQLLGRLYLPPQEEEESSTGPTVVVEKEKAAVLVLLMATLKFNLPLEDATSRNAFDKFETALRKRYPASLEYLGEDEWWKSDSGEDEKEEGSEALVGVKAFWTQCGLDQDRWVANAPAAGTGGGARKRSTRSASTTAGTPARRSTRAAATRPTRGNARKEEEDSDRVGDELEEEDGAESIVDEGEEEDEEEDDDE